MSLEEEILDLISFNFSIKKEKTKKSSKLESFGLNLLDIAELHQDIEERYKLEIPSEESKYLEIIGNLINYVEKNQNTASYSLEEQ